MKYAIIPSPNSRKTFFSLFLSLESQFNFILRLVTRLYCPSNLLTPFDEFSIFSDFPFSDGGGFTRKLIPNQISSIWVMWMPSGTWKTRGGKITSPVLGKISCTRLVCRWPPFPAPQNRGLFLLPRLFFLLPGGNNRARWETPPETGKKFEKKRILNFVRATRYHKALKCRENIFFHFLIHVTAFLEKLFYTGRSYTHARTHTHTHAYAALVGKLSTLNTY